MNSKYETNSLGEKIDTEKKYVINVDFPTSKGENGHKIHLNPYVHGSTLRKKILRHYDHKISKITTDGGAFYTTREEALEYLKGKKQKEWLGKVASNFRPCKVCKGLPEWDLKERIVKL